MDGLAGDGVGEVQEVGVEEVASVAGEAGEGFEGVAGGAVEGGRRPGDGRWRPGGSGSDVGGRSGGLRRRWWWLGSGR